MNGTCTQAVKAIIEFGYSPEYPDGSLVKYKAGHPREKWEPLEDRTGFLRFTREDGKWVPVPFTIAEKFEGVSGLTSETHPECFEYVYPADYVLNIYATAVAERG